MASAVSYALNLSQVAFSVYNLWLASISIMNLQKYEEKSKKAAEYSNTAARELHKTRTTQTSAALAILASCLSSAGLLFYRSSTIGKLGVATVNIGALGFATQHVGDHWRGKAKIPLPGVGAYNEAISKTQEARLNMHYLAASWGAVMLLSLF